MRTLITVLTYHFTVIVMDVLLKCCHDAREVGHQLPKPEHLGPREVVDYVQSSYPAGERLMAIDGGQLWTMYQAVKSITDQLGVCVCACVCVQMYMCK